jgi:uncharacterized protein YggE
MKALILLFAFTAVVFSESQDWNRTTVLEVNGEAKREIIPEYFMLSPEVIIFSNKSKTAYDSVKIIIDKMLSNIHNTDSSALVAMTDISVATIDRWSGNGNKRGAYKGYAKIEIISKRLELASEMMKACVDANATEIGRPQLKSDKTDSVSGVLRQEAFQNAQHRAERSAKEYGATLGRIISLRSTNSFPAKVDDIAEKIFGNADHKYHDDLIGSLMGGDGLLESRKLIIEEDVDIYYELKWK